MMNVDEILKEAARCVRCGTCKSSCPTFAVLGKEPSGPRGRVTLVEARFSGEQGFTKAYVKDLKDCTLCGSCKYNCPNDVDVPSLVIAGRVESVEREGLSLAASMVLKNVVNSSWVMPTVMKAASMFQGVLFKSSERENGLISRFALPLIGGGRLVPEIAREFFLEKPEVRKLSFEETGKKKRSGIIRAAFYAGCGVNYLLPGIGDATLKALKAAGVDIVVPSEQLCCGMPALSAGDEATAKDLVIKNLEAFGAGEYDYVVTSCATCGHALKQMFNDVLRNESEALRRRALEFSAKVRDITEFLDRDIGIQPSVNGAGKGKKVAYHDPCHLRRYQNIADEPRNLIDKSGAVYTRMKNPCKCCGLGGGLAFSNYEASVEIGRKKAESIKESGAEVVATACPGCIVQLKDSLNRNGVDVEVVHVVELL
ncbi:MAG: (Fe-S)-binding protein [Deltaproteobacteria bacterium]|nr:(Fe-S)-binding protein [Deltaproteobacteria bacterium]